MEPLNLTVYFVPVFAICILAENIIARKRQPERFQIKDSFTSIIMGIGSVLINLVTATIVITEYKFVSQFAIFKIEPVWWSWLVLLFAEDFCYYWFHRIGHESRFFWASHVVHHSSESYNLSTAVRQTWTGTMINAVFWFPLLILGFPPEMVVAQQAISLIYQFFIHTEQVKTLGFLELFMNTPSHHRVHHGSDLKYLDRNYAGIFIIWDKAFGSFQAEEEVPTYGLVKNLHTYNPIKVAYIEWFNMFKQMFQVGSFVNAIKVMFKPPGWSPEGGTTTSELQRQAGLRG
jgi:sterol desaturase/sphingolipid hydroxylase (fatty acid hydroxylase superfamily)